MFQAIYKCRLCGKIFKKGNESVGRAIGIATRLTSEDNFVQGDVYGSRHEIHNCEDGSCGFSDFQGFKKVEE